MSEKYNDDKIRKILESEKVPEGLEPESVKVLLEKFSREKRLKITIKRRISKIIPIAAAFAITFSTIGWYVIRDTHYCSKCSISLDRLSVNADIDTISFANDYSDVYDYFKAVQKKNEKLKDVTLFKESDVMLEEAAGDSLDTGANTITGAGSQQTNDYSDTYNQEEGVLEADIVKTDGNYIYYANNDTINVAQVSNGDFLNTTQLHKDSETIQDMYIYNNMLIVISNKYYNTGSEQTCGVYYNYFNNDTCLSFYSIGENPQLLGSYTQGGWYNDVRLTDDGYLYLISNEEKNCNENSFSEESYENYIPKYTVNENEKYVEANCILISEYCPDNYISCINYANISAFNLNNISSYEPTDIKSVVGYSGTIYCSGENLYLTCGYEETEITRFFISKGTVTLQASGKVKGYVNDQFSMSEYNGYFRIAVTEETWDNSWNPFEDLGIVSSDTQEEINNTLYVLDMDLKVVGSITDFGLNETIKSVNFNGDKAYIVTFRQTDPLYAIDLSKPENPVMMDEFKINGYSSYMQKWSDGLLLGFGQNADNDGRITGVKLTMFDNSNPENLKTLSTIEINSDYNESYSKYISSLAVWERKALIIDPEKNIIGFPVNKDIYIEGTESCASQQYFAFYSFENGTFRSLGDIYETTCNRAVMIGEYVYILSDSEFKSADIATFNDIKNINFN